MSERSKLLHHWLADVLKTSGYQLKPASEDASFRFYYRVTINNESYIVMDAPPQLEDCGRFIDITERLHQCGVMAPVIHEKNIEQGFLLLTDFGNELFLPNLQQGAADTLYKSAIDALVRIQAGGNVTGLNAYDEELLRREMALFPDWLLVQHLQIDLSKEVKKVLDTLADELVKNALEQPQVFVHRDYHSRNLMLIDENSPGIIDYQDAVYGPLSYDPVSLLKDCYIKWSAEEVKEWVNYYLVRLKDLKPEIKTTRDQFRRWFDLMGVQRQLKASGIFARLSHRDGKHGFLNDIPRTLSYITDLRDDYPELRPLSDLIEERVLPGLERQA